MDTKIIIIIILIIAIIYLISVNYKNDEHDDPTLQLIEFQVKRVVDAAGYRTNFNLQSSHQGNYTKNKHDVFLCKSCMSVEEDLDPIEKQKQEMEKMMYIGLHEASHTISKTKNHSQEWKTIFFRLMNIAADYGYLDREKFMIE